MGRHAGRPLLQHCDASRVPADLWPGGGATSIGDARADCTGAANQSLPVGNYGYSWAICVGQNGIDKKDEKAGGPGDAITFESQGTYTVSVGDDVPYAVPYPAGGLITMYSGGGGGVDEGTAGAGGPISLTSHGDVTLSGSGDPGEIGGLIFAVTEGGDGDPNNDNYKSNGGNGGAGGTVTVTNSGTLTINADIQNYGKPFSGILAVSSGGYGGNQDSGIAGDQVGGRGGSGGIVTVNNNGQININTVNNPPTGVRDAWGVAGQSLGGNGGADNGAGGDGGNIAINNGASGDAAITVYANVTDSVRGIYAISQGSNGIASADSSDNGGAGAAGGQIDVTTSSDITVAGTGGANALSGGIVGVNLGGQGGGGYNKSNGGVGGAGSPDGAMTLTVGSGATVWTQGDNIAGIVGVTRGGRGGDGLEGEKNSSGGDGGSGGQIQIDIYGAVETNGSHAYGLLGQSIGGQGGNGGSDTAAVGSSGGGGYGGNAGGVGAYTTEGASITTHGDFSAGVTLHSIGGGGGTGGDFTDVLGGGAGNGGNGGNGGTATINNAAAISTSGQHSYGILVQSIGGSGGTGGIATGLTLELGGDGGNGGLAGTASVQNAGIIITTGFSAHGIIAQSISGGGGAAGMAGGILSIGGIAGAAGNAVGGPATIQNGAAVSTAGDAAIGIMAQSIGGGGGNGGNVIDMSIGIPAVGIGGNASGGGSGGTVCVTNQDAGGTCSTGVSTVQPVIIGTAGAGALGILAQSVGGGGGNGGNAIGGDAGLGSFQIGGTGGAGGFGDTVDVAFQGLNLTTQGSHAAGVVAQSIGGGGGNGGMANSYTASIGFTASVAVGGAGGSGGGSEQVTVHLTDSTIGTGLQGGDITDAIGVLAQSISGGGGTGGSSVADALAAAVPTGEGVSLAMSVSTAVGGSGGSTHTGGNVTLILDGSTSVATRGASSHGLVAQSIGGGGGNGGSASTLAATAGLGDTVSADIGVSVGGSGSGGGDGGTVSVTLDDTASMATVGDYANAIVVQTIGGGGGNGGVGSVNSDQIFSAYNLTAKVGVGGSGGGGGSGGSATVDLDSGTTLQTGGSGARGVLVQSIGGGGGASQGVSVGLSGSSSIPGGGEGGEEGEGSITAAVTVSVGRTGAGGGNGGAVTVATAGGIATSGADADGVLAQSIGGGGGLGGSTGSASSSGLHIRNDKNSKYAFEVGVGGSGGTAADGGAVTLTHSGRITTIGDWADGIVAQSIGGGGGTAGTSTASGSEATANITVGVGGRGGGGGQGGSIAVTFDDNHGNSVNTSGYSAYGVLLQSIGGGGGQGGDGSDKASGEITVGGGFGGEGGAGGSGGTVTAQGWINLSTSGEDAHGIVAQSIGGGGGVGGAGSSRSGDALDGPSIDLVVGGSGGVGGNGGEVNLTLGTTLRTYGARAFGIVAQSIGGGGGIGSAGEAAGIASIVVGGAGGGEINGGAVVVDLTAESSVSTQGDGAHGIVAQSIGGGGGIGGTASGASLSFEGISPGSYGNGGSVEVTVDGDISTTGASAFGVLAQSIGGGGGFGGNATSAFMGSNGNLDSYGMSDAVTVTLEAARTITTSGDGSIGIFAQSDAGTESNGPIQVIVNGTVAGGFGDTGVGVMVAGGGENVLTVNSGGSVSSASGVAVQYVAGLDASAGGTLAVENSGTISGSVNGVPAAGSSADIAMARIGGGKAISIVNRSGGHLTDARLYDADVRNHGRLVVGASGAYDDARITGDLTQAGGGVMAIDADFLAARADRLTVEGDATLAGRLEVNAAAVLPGASLRFLTVDGTLDHALGAQSALFDYGIVQQGNELSVSVDAARFGDPGFSLDEDQGRVADHLQAIWDAGGGPFGTLFGALGSLADRGNGSYASGLSDLSPGVSSAAAAGSIAMTQQHLDLLLSCPIFAGGTAFLTETSCTWAQAGAQAFDQKASGGISGFDTTIYAMQAGVQAEHAQNWFVGFAGGYDRMSIRGDDGRVHADGDVIYGGASLKHQTGPWLLSGAVSGSYGWYDNTRTIRIPGFSGQAESSPDVSNVSARLRAAYTFAQDAYYIRPLVDFDLIYTHAGGYRETGAGLLDLQVDGTRQWSFHATPAVEVGTRLALGERTVMRAFAAAGVSFSSVDSWDTSARLAEARGIGAFDSQVPLADLVGRLTVGVDITSDDGFSVRLDYEGAYSDTYTSHGGALRLGYRF